MAAHPSKADEIHRRLINFGARTTRVAKMLPKTDDGRYIALQLMGSGLAAAPNYAEARAAESRADFIHKLRTQRVERDEVLAGTNRSQCSLSSRQNGLDYRGKPGTLLDYRSFN
jgi:four helix bundle protein